MTRKEEIEIILQKLLMRAIPNVAASAELKDIKKYCRGVSKNAKESSKTFSGVAKAMAEQWGTFISSRNVAACL